MIDNYSRAKERSKLASLWTWIKFRVQGTCAIWGNKHFMVTLTKEVGEGVMVKHIVAMSKGSVAIAARSMGDMIQDIKEEDEARDAVIDVKDMLKGSTN